MIFLDTKMTAWRKKFMNSEESLRVFGWVFAIISVLALKTQSHVTYDAEGLLVLFAWMMLIKSIALAWFPGKYIATIVRSKEKIMKTSAGQMGMGILSVVFAAFFTYLGVILI